MADDRSTFYLKRGDTAPSLLCALLPLTTDLTGATARFSLRRADTGVIIVNRALAVVVTATGAPTVRYDWQPANTAAEGDYHAEFEVTYAGGAVETFPNSAMINVRISGDIA